MDTERADKKNVTHLILSRVHLRCDEFSEQQRIRYKIEDDEAEKRFWQKLRLVGSYVAKMEHFGPEANYERWAAQQQWVVSRQQASRPSFLECSL